jgi:enamine deaminase RidA (YjgF/YER057c/UK114 family)
LLEQAGAELGHVVLERAFFEDFAKDMESFKKIRKTAYEQAGIDEGVAPAMTYIQQPPARPAQKVELQIYAVLPKTPESASVRTFLDYETGTTSKLLTIGGYKHLYIADIKGVRPNADRPVDFREQSDRMFENCERLLARHGVKFPKVLRTWCYLWDIDNTYADFNLSRNAFFKREGVHRLPASTGIEATLWPHVAQVGMDLYALLNPEGAKVEVMHTPTLNEADEYGSAFSRGMKIELPEKTVLHISGTASVDEKGDTVHLDDPRNQIERMLLNVDELLAAQGASFSDITQIATFLKKAEYLDTYKEILSRRGDLTIPNTFVETGVCRPNLLCELEAIAILPKSPTSGQPVAAEPVSPPNPR